MVRPDEVRATYRLILGREPENDQVVAEHAVRHRSVADLHAALLGSVLWPGRFRGPAMMHPTDAAQLSAARREARKIARRLAPWKGWFRPGAVIRDRSERCGPATDFIFLQTCDPDRYFEMWAAGSQTVRRYCTNQGFAYEAYIGIKSGYFPWHATYNRIFLFKELWERKFRGWAIYIDADAVIANQDFDLRTYLRDKSEFAAVLTHTGEAQWWQVNIGVMMLNFAHPWTGQLVTKLLDLFIAYCRPHLPNAKTWDDLPDDQGVLRYLLIENEDLARRHIYLEGGFLNFGSAETLSAPHLPFVQHILQYQGSLEERTEVVARLTREILARTPNTKGAALS
jgi:hypothetical protein